MNRTGCQPAGPTGSVVKIRKRQAPFSVIPDYILEDIRMRTETRLVLGWLLGRPDGWEVRVTHVQKKLGLTEGRWKTSRKEMELYGFLEQKRIQKCDGTFRWDHIVTDTPVEMKSTIVGFSTDGLTTDGKPADITAGSKQEDLNTPLNPPVAITQACAEEARQRFPGYDIYVMEATWKEWLSGKNDRPKKPDNAFLAWARTYTKNHPLPFGGGF